MILKLTNTLIFDKMISILMMSMNNSLLIQVNYFD